jgi:hypothetical protein
MRKNLALAVATLLFLGGCTIAPWLCSSPSQGSGVGQSLLLIVCLSSNASV